MDVGFVIQTLRKRKRISQGEFAKRCQLSQTSLSLIESTKRHTRRKTLEIICHQLNIQLPMLYILGAEKGDIPADQWEVFSVAQNYMKEKYK